MDTLVNLLVATLATWQSVEVWHHGSLFATCRASVQLWRGLWGWLGELLTCPFCLSVWVGWLCWMATMTEWTFWLVAGLATSRLANVANDITKAISQTPNRLSSLMASVSSLEEKKT